MGLQVSDATQRLSVSPRELPGIRCRITLAHQDDARRFGFSSDRVKQLYEIFFAFGALVLDAGSPHQLREEMVRVSIRTPGTTRRRALDLPAESQVAEVRQVVANELGSSYERLKLIVGGKALEDEKNSKPSTVTFVDGDSLIAVVVPKAPPTHISSRNGEVEDEDEDLRFKLPESATLLQRQLATFLREKLKVPDLVLIVLFSVSPRAWLLIILWFALLPIARRWDLGPLYIITTVFAVMFWNLGKRQPGEASAYSIFNEDFRELPGTLNADRLDRDIRAGQF